MNETAANSDGQRGIVSIPGDNPLDRYLTIALRNAGGIKPTADLTQIEIIRGDRLLRKIDLSGIFQGDPIEDLPLIANDRVIVPRSPQGFQKSLVRRSIITPRLVPLYVSNISQPVLGRSQENLTRASTVNFAYGTRLSQVLIFSDCIGGNFIEDERRALLVRVDSQTEEVKALQYSVEEVVRRSPLQEELDPLMMPYDGVACYDSALANSENFFTLLNNFLRPFETISNIFRALDNFFFDNNNNR
jgi:polysaccharide export outer membrane protein